MTYISDFLQKANIFNEYFAIQCTINDNGSVLPAHIPKTNKSISHFLITEKQIIDITSKLNANTSQGYDHTSVAMLQLCSTRKLLSLCKLFFKNVYLLEHSTTFGSMLIFSLFIKMETFK